MRPGRWHRNCGKPVRKNAAADEAPNSRCPNKRAVRVGHRLRRSLLLPLAPPHRPWHGLGVLELQLNDEGETLALAGALADLLAPGDLILLEGSLGAGKTTFARGAIHALGVPADTPVTSPTFALVHQYQGRLSVVHVDFYRLVDAAELGELGIDELLEEGSVLLVEWGGKFPSVASRATLCIDFEIVSDDARLLRISSRTARGEELIAALSSLR